MAIGLQTGGGQLPGFRFHPGTRIRLKSADRCRMARQVKKNMPGELILAMCSRKWKVKDHGHGPGRLDRDVAPGAVAVVIFFSAPFPSHSIGPTSTSPSEALVGPPEKVLQHGADGSELIAVPLLVREPQP